MQLPYRRNNACGHRHAEPTRPIFFTTMSNAGGEGKTLVSLAIIALCCLQQEAACVLDADIGNWSMRQQVEQASLVGWGVKTIKADEIADDSRGAHTVLDLGANALASATEMTALVPALRKAFAHRGYDTIAFIPVSTNKVGAVGAAVELADSVTGFTKIFVKVNRDGSAAFDAEFEEGKVIDLGHLQTGFQQYFRGPGAGIVDAILHPPSGYIEASRHLAEWLRDFASQEPICDLFPGALRVLNDVPPPAGNLVYVVRNLKAASDDEIADNMHRAKIVKLLNKHGWTPAGLRSAADVIGSAN